MTTKNYFLEITNHGKYALWQSLSTKDDILTSTVISKPIGEKSPAIYTKDEGDEQGLVLIEKDFCVIEALSKNNQIIEIYVNKVSEINDDVAVTKTLYEFKSGKWNTAPPAFLEKAISTCMYNAQNPYGPIEYYTINQKMTFYRSYQKQCG